MKSVKAILTAAKRAVAPASVSSATSKSAKKTATLPAAAASGKRPGKPTGTPCTCRPAPAGYRWLGVGEKIRRTDLFCYPTGQTERPDKSDIGFKMNPFSAAPGVVNLLGGYLRRVPGADAADAAGARRSESESESESESGRERASGADRGPGVAGDGIKAMNTPAPVGAAAAATTPTTAAGASPLGAATQTSAPVSALATATRTSLPASAGNTVETATFSAFSASDPASPVLRAGRGYRLLRPGETLAAGDEVLFRAATSEAWLSVGSAEIGRSWAAAAATSGYTAARRPYVPHGGGLAAIPPGTRTLAAGETILASDRYLWGREWLPREGTRRVGTPYQPGKNSLTVRTVAGATAPGEGPGAMREGDAGADARGARLGAFGDGTVGVDEAAILGTSVDAAGVTAEAAGRAILGNDFLDTAPAGSLRPPTGAAGNAAEAERALLAGAGTPVAGLGALDDGGAALAAGVSASTAARRKLAASLEESAALAIGGGSTVAAGIAPAGATAAPGESPAAALSESAPASAAPLQLAASYRSLRAGHYSVEVERFLDGRVHLVLTGTAAPVDISLPKDVADTLQRGLLLTQEV